MTPDDLQKWLLTDAIRDDLRRVSLSTVALEFDALSRPDADSARIDWSRLLLAGSILARSSSRRMEESALRIATAAVLIGADASIRDTGALLLEKLSNGRAVMLAQSRGLIAPELSARLGVAARVEATNRLVSQTVLEQFTGDWIPVNEFQEEFWAAASSDRGWLSASAPTASGKTFLVRHWLLDTMLTTTASVAVYIAPTRALVSEIETCFKDLAKKLTVESDVEVVSLPMRDSYKSAADSDKKTLFVFTQERLHLLANVVGGDLAIDILVVDEAHKIGDGGRGVILQAAIERVGRMNPAMQVVFISPATQNPEILLQDAPHGVHQASIDSDLPTVLQNIIFATQVPGRSTAWELRLRHGEEMFHLGTLALQHRPTTVRKKIAFIAAAAGSRGGTLVYANGAAEAETIAVLISQTITHEYVDEDLQNLAELARKGVHPAYQLANVVEKGVAFHYGNMPSLLRLEIERLFRVGKLKFLVCTSTLVEGVNLSCRTIVVRGPRKGKGHPMEAADFWNLAGRAGRWGDEFQGNIICIDPHDSKAWPAGIPDRARYPIQRETDAVLQRRQDLEAFIASRGEATTKELIAHSDLEQVTSYLLATHLTEGTILAAPFAKRHDPEYLHRLDVSLCELTASVELPSDLVAKHPGVSAVGLQRLLERFRSEPGREETFIPEQPESDGAYNRLCYIMLLINESIFPAFSPDARIPLFSLVVIEWLKGFPLSYMIRRRLEYHRRHGQAVKLGEVIRSTMELVEQIARFRAPKYLAAYVDVLRYHLHQVGREQLLQEDLDIAVALEFGISTRTLLSLMELGLSRMSAVALNDVIADASLNQQQCLSWLRSNRSVLEGSDIPVLILREVYELPRLVQSLSG